MKGLGKHPAWPEYEQLCEKQAELKARLKEKLSSKERETLSKELVRVETRTEVVLGQLNGLSNGHHPHTQHSTPGL